MFSRITLSLSYHFRPSSASAASRALHSSGDRGAVRSAILITCEVEIETPRASRIYARRAATRFKSSPKRETLIFVQRFSGGRGARAFCRGRDFVSAVFARSRDCASLSCRIVLFILSPLCRDYFERRPPYFLARVAVEGLPS